ncbi:3-hydroxyacyl-ACP dehydratase FabZ [Nisaea denitrificans]|uniref:3-hydroxyacyl-ACP dehydratase FabZ n=1 Tax=Nisaea denitrificans TaxID=390877 RepID=UPI0004065C5C|nr:3-hydroxyacyl-ACP dehydratase FabZ [Nisaea denitrificans]
MGAADIEVGTAVETDIDVNRVMELIPHRYPFLMVDKIEEIELGVKAVGVKNVSINENFFQGHFPTRPVFPGVLIIEAMAQTAGCLVVATLGKEAEGKLVYFMTIDDARFRKPVVPGDQIKIHVEKARNRGPVWKFTGAAKVDDVLVAEATFSAMIVDQ